MKSKKFWIQGIEIEEEPIWSDHLAYFFLLCPHEYHQPEHFYVNFLLKSLVFNVGLIVWDGKCLSSKEDATDIARQGPRLSIRIDIWILPSDTIRG